MIAYVTGNAEPIYGQSAHAETMRAMFDIFPDVHVDNDPYSIQFGGGDWIDLDFGQTSRWDDDQLVEISAFWDSALQAR